MTETLEQLRARRQSDKHRNMIGKKRAQFVKAVRSIIDRNDIDGFQKVIRIRSALAELDGRAA